MNMHEEIRTPEAYDFMKEGEGKAFVFICYSHADKTMVYEQIEILQNKGYRIWYDGGLSAGTIWDNYIKNAINHCYQFIVFMSRNAFGSKYIKEEVKMALDLRNKPKNDPSSKVDKFIIPLYLESEDIIDRYYDTAWDDLKEVHGLQWEYLENFHDEELLQPITNEKHYCTQDVENLNLGCLPEDADIRVEHLSLSKDEKYQRINSEIKDYLITNNNYSIDNVFQLTSLDPSAIENFKNIDFRNPIIKSINTGTIPISLLSRQLDIKLSYIVPFKLLTGLITRLEENWPPMIKCYQKLVTSGKGSLGDMHYFIEFCWLAWGPSVTTMGIENTRKITRFMLLQVAYGDEANSVPLILSHDSWEKVKNKVPRNGKPVALNKLLVVNLTDDLFFQKNIPISLKKIMNLGKDNHDDKIIALYFPDEKDKAFFNGLNKEIACSPGEIESADSDLSFYSTSYVWLILEQIEGNEFQESKNRKMTGPICPGKCIPFFEHANLASPKILDFLHHCLVRKAIYHVIDCEENFNIPAHYVLSTALFPDDIKAIFEKEKSRLNDKNRQIVESRLRVPSIGNMRSHNDVVQFSLDLSKKILGCLR